jgi:hypothetical protein
MQRLLADHHQGRHGVEVVKLWCYRPLGNRWAYGVELTQTPGVENGNPTQTPDPRSER